MLNRVTVGAQQVGQRHLVPEPVVVEVVRARDRTRLQCRDTVVKVQSEDNFVPSAFFALVPTPRTRLCDPRSMPLCSLVLHFEQALAVGLVVCTVVCTHLFAVRGVMTALRRAEFFG